MELMDVKGTRSKFINEVVGFCFELQRKSNS